MERRFRKLRIIARLYKLAAWVIIALSILVAAQNVTTTDATYAQMNAIRDEQLRQFGLSVPAQQPGVLLYLQVILVPIIAGALVALVFYTFSELIELLISVEHNMRITGSYFWQVIQRKQ